MLTRGFARILATVVAFSLSSAALAAEISMVSGIYQGTKTKIDGDDQGGESAISLGARYAEPLTDAFHWYGEGSLTLRSYDAPDGLKAPSDSTSIALFGGVRIYFPEFSQVVTPYFGGRAGFQSIKEGSVGVAATEQEKSGLYYGGSLGFRFEVATDFFAELETQVFESALFATETIDNGTTKTEHRHIDIFVDSKGGIGAATAAVGMRL